MVGTDFDLPRSLEEPPNLGPRCASCGKPYRLSAEKGGCKCERHPSGADITPTRTLAADRQAAALEGILAVLEKIDKKLGVK